MAARLRIQPLADDQFLGLGEGEGVRPSWASGSLCDWEGGAVEPAVDVAPTLGGSHSGVRSGWLRSSVAFTPENMLGVHLPDCSGACGFQAGGSSGSG